MYQVDTLVNPSAEAGAPVGTLILMPVNRTALVKALHIYHVQQQWWCLLLGDCRFWD